MTQTYVVLIYKTTYTNVIILITLPGAFYERLKKHIGFCCTTVGTTCSIDGNCTTANNEGCSGEKCACATDYMNKGDGTCVSNGIMLLVLTCQCNCNL